MQPRSATRGATAKGSGYYAEEVLSITFQLEVALRVISTDMLQKLIWQFTSSMRLWLNPRDYIPEYPDQNFHAIGQELAFNYLYFSTISHVV
jgi:hypothetical protein